jgi:hypothetical protein
MSAESATAIPRGQVSIFFFWFSREFMWFIGIWELGLLRFVDMGIKVWIFLWMNQVDLLDFIDFSGVECLNQSTSHSLSNAIKQVIVVSPFKQNLNPNSCCYHWFFMILLSIMPL